MTDMEKRALDVLRSFGDTPCYEQMKQSLLRGEAEVLMVEDTCVLTRHRLERFCMLAGEETRMREMAKLVPADAREVLVHGVLTDEAVEGFKNILGMTDVEPYVMYGYYGEMPPEETQAQIRPLTAEDLDFVYENYGHASRGYLDMLLKKGVMIGAYVDGALAGFIGEHAAGAMGLLHVMPEFRRHHLGFALERADIRRILLSGSTPFCQVAVANTPSHNLQERLGLTRAEGRMYWMSRAE